MRARLAGAVLVAGAAAYAVATGPLDAPFAVTPAAVALSALAAGVVSGQARLLVIGLGLGGWGAAVLLVDRGVTADGRAAAAYTVGVAVGLAAAAAVARRTGAGLGGALCSVALAGAAAYLAPDVDALGDDVTWALLLAAWGVVEAVRARRRPV